MIVEIPYWLLLTWYILSALFFLLNLAAFAAIGFLAFQMIGFLKEVRPKANVLMTRGEALMSRMENVASNAEEVLSTTKERVTAVSDQAVTVMGSVNSITSTASRQFERFAPFIMGSIAAIKVVRALYDATKGRRSLEMKVEETEDRRTGRSRRPLSRRSRVRALMDILPHLPNPIPIVRSLMRR
jgi:hypothetical protein